MSAIRTSWTICRHSLTVLNGNRRLLAFPVAMALVNLATVLLVTLPVMFGVTIVDVWHTVSDPVASVERLNEAVNAAGSEANVQAFLEYQFPYAGFVLSYLVGILATTFVNVASYSEILLALDGRGVSVTRGFRFAISKLRAVVIWSLFAGTIGVLIRVVLQKIPLIRGWIAGLIGVSWSVASIFVIPVMIREDSQGNPVDWLRSSARLIKRSWGEALGLIVGPVLALFLTGVAAMLLYIVAGGTVYKITPAPFDGVVFLFILISSVILMPFVITCAGATLMQIFRGSLYIYAEEGVAPGSFDASLLDKAWTIRDRAGN